MHSCEGVDRGALHLILDVRVVYHESVWSLDRLASHFILQIDDVGDRVLRPVVDAIQGFFVKVLCFELLLVCLVQILAVLEDLVPEVPLVEVRVGGIELLGLLLVL